MLPVEIHLDGDGAWPDLKDLVVPHGVLKEVAYLDHGMQSGKPSVTMRIEMDNGDVVLAETSVALFVMIAAALKGKALRAGFDV